MREYGQVQCSFWQSPDVTNLSDTGKLLALYLLTCPHSNGIGCYPLPDGYVMADLGWSSETVSKGFAELSRKGFANRFEQVVFIPNFLRWNRIANPNVAKARAAEFETLPKGEGKAKAAKMLLELGAHWEERFRNRLETVWQTCSKQNPTLPNPTQTLPREGAASANPFETVSNRKPPKGTNGSQARRPAKRCPADFKITDPLRQWAKANCPDVDIEAETRLFRDYEFGKAHTDWPATWRVWMAREQKRVRPHPAAVPLSRHARAMQALGDDDDG